MQQLAALFLALLLLVPQRAAACASCACGDPTLVSMGAEQPFAGRLRLSTALRTRTETMGAGADRSDLEEQRVDLAAAWSPLSWLTLSATLPLVRRALAHADLARETTHAPGDVELRARAYVWRSRDFSPDHLLAVHAGLELPSAPLLRRDGALLPDEVQAGTASLDGLVGLSWLHLRGPLSIYASATGLLPTESRMGFTPGEALLATAAAQLQPLSFLAVRLAADTRWEAPATEHDGSVRADTGGFAAFATPALLWSPATDLLVQAQVQLPVLQRMRGAHAEGLGFGIGVSHDL